MGAEKHGSKSGGGYVGSFLQLFDWNGKSRKKLFSNKSDNREGSKLGKRSHPALVTSQPYHKIDDEDNAGSSIKGSSDYSCASSVTDEEANGTKAPGVVARLMGLDSLPTSSVTEPHSTPYIDSRFLRDVEYRRTPDFSYQHEIMNSGKQTARIESVSQDHVESRSQKMMNTPIEKFQAEVLPPKSAKTIPITHHKLLSPIKSPGFIQTKNAAQIMEAAARIIEPGPRVNTKGKMSPVGSSSVPLKLRNLKEKVESTHRPSRIPEVSQRPIESKAVKYLKGQSLNKSWNGVEDAPELRPSSSHSEDDSSARLKSKGKSVSLAVQAKVNVQRREGLSLSSSRSSQRQKEHNEFVSSQPFKGQQNIQQTVQKKPSVHTASTVLRQNNQKQNGSTKIDKVLSKASVSNQKGRRSLPGDASFGRNKTSNKVIGTSKIGPRNTALGSTDIEKVVPLSITHRPQKKRSIDGDFYLEKHGVVDNMFVDRDVRPTIEAHSKLVEDNRWKGMEVVSFTFTSPMKKPTSGSESSKPVVGFSSEKLPNDRKNTKLFSLGLNEIGGDALSILLEQKLKELTQGIGPSFDTALKSRSVATFPSVQPDFVSDLNVSSTISEECDNRSQHAEELSSVYDSNSFATEDHMLQGGVGDHRANSNSEVTEEFKCRDPSPISVLEPSFSNESCNSSDSGGDNTGSRQCSSIQTEQVDSNSPQKHVSIEIDSELSDSASSTFIGSMNEEHTSRFNLVEPQKIENWELEYVREVLCNAELMLKDFVLGRTNEILKPHHFAQLENWKPRLGSDSEEYNDAKLRRKVLFDCVGECLDLRCRPYVGGGCRGRAKGEAMLQRKEWLAEEIYKEISGWRSMGDWMLDGLVDKDMSTHYGRWIDFEIDEFELGIDIGKGILSSLVDEVVADIFLA